MQHFQGLIDMIESIGCEVIYLAPYDPRCNPIEAAFSQVSSPFTRSDWISQILFDMCVA